MVDFFYHNIMICKFSLIINSLFDFDKFLCNESTRLRVNSHICYYKLFMVETTYNLVYCIFSPCPDLSHSEGHRLLHQISHVIGGYQTCSNKLSIYAYQRDFKAKDSFCNNFNRYKAARVTC